VATTPLRPRIHREGVSKDNDTATSREWAGLAVLALPTLLVSTDIFVLLLALPRLAALLRHVRPNGEPAHATVPDHAADADAPAAMR
jgi:hypothetical protein